MKRILSAFFNSLAAIRWGFRSEAALREELSLLAISLPVAPLITLDPWKLAAMWGSLLLILAVEFLNTGIEKLADKVTLDRDELVRIAKDCGSAAVLMACLIAALVWGAALAERVWG